MSTISTHETLAPREAKLPRPAADDTQAQPLYARIWALPRLHKLIYLFADVFAITLSHTSALHTVQRFLPAPTGPLNPFEYHRFYIPFFAVILYLFDGYKSPELRRPEQELERSCKAVAVSFLGLVLFNFVVFRSQVFSRYLLASWFILACVVLVGVRFGLRALQGKLWKAGHFRRRAVLIGSPSGLAEYRQLLLIQRHHCYDIVGILTDPIKTAAPLAMIPDIPVLGPLNQWERILESTKANVLIVAYSPVSDGEAWTVGLLQRCKQLRVDVELYSCVLATAHMDYEHDEFSGCFRFYARPEWSAALQRAMKRGIDVAIGLVGSLATLLLTPIVWILVNLEDRGPVFYSREFVGSDAQIHYYRKFRTMLKDADDILRRDPDLKAEFVRQYKLKDDPRMLRIGRLMRRFSLDEFPQFFSVLSGKLTFVGPRVISGEEKERYGTLLPKLLSFRPGLTGFWQVMGRQTTTYHERVHMDMFYIDRWSIWLDLVIIAKTFWKVLKAEGAY
jgi:exopolysaccharide biosynthesis polyprenyl glycosylphosphotransferase